MTARPDCLICTRCKPNRDGSHSKDCRHVAQARGRLCVSCHARLRDALAEIPDLVATAADELAPGRAGGASGRSSETPIGVRVDALSLDLEVIAVLGTWEQDWRELLGFAELENANADVRRPRHHPDADGACTGRCYHPGVRDALYGAIEFHTSGSQGRRRRRATITGCAGFLLSHLDWACGEHLAIDEFHAEVLELHGAARRAARSVEREAWVVSCPTDTVRGLCGASLRVTGEDLHAVIVCPRCRTEWAVDRLLLVVNATKDAEVWLPAAEIALLLGCDDSTLRKWARAGIVKRRGTLYEVTSCRDAAAMRLSGHADRAGA